MPLKIRLILIIALSLSACGYHPRGAIQLPTGMNNVYMEGGSSQLQNHFKSAMAVSSVPVASSPEKAGIIVRIFDEDSQRRVMSLSSGGTANDFELGYRFEYELVDANDRILSARQPIEIKREYYNNQLAIIAKDSEEMVIRDEMYQQAVRMIINRASIALQASPK
ncbi:MAG: LPS assembly lipoprotein LptE [Methylococcales bacterium]|nr:LPS assembly lipoprotein LptE [Methylococcales bacterium]